jgi:hypothetical protein
MAGPFDWHECGMKSIKFYQKFILENKLKESSVMNTPILKEASPITIDDLMKFKPK